MPSAESLKEYLVKLGWDVDEIGLKKAVKSLDLFESKSSSMGAKLVSSFVSAGVAVGSFLLTTNLGIAKLIDSVADADIATERWARRMWTTEEQARSFLSALDAMDASFEDVFYMTPEEYRNMTELKNLASSLQAPDELNSTLKLVRDIGQEINKTKVIFNYATQWIAYYVGRYMGTDIKNIHELWASFNNYLIEKLPTATEKIAKFFTIIYKLGKTAVETIQRLSDALSKLLNDMPSGAKKAGAAITGFMFLLKTGPIGMFIAALLALLLLLDDFYTWQSGGKSAYGGTWEKLSNMFQNMDTSGLDSLKEKTDGLLDSVWDLFGACGDLFKTVWDFLDQHGVIEQILDSFIGSLELIVDFLQAAVDLLLILLGKVDLLDDDSPMKKVFGTPAKTGGFTGFMQGAGNVSMGIMDSINYAWNKVLGQKEGDAFYAGAWSDMFGYDYSWGANNDAARTTTGGGTSGAFSGSTSNDNRKVTQNNNITINANGSSDAGRIGRSVQDSVSSWDPFK